MANVKTILANTTEHVVIAYVIDTAGTETTLMSALGGTDETSTIAIEHVEYSIVNDKSVKVQFQDGGATATPALEFYGQGELGRRSGLISATSALAEEKLNVIFDTGAFGTVILTIKKMSGW